jgi:hypothetical protein
MSDRREGRMSGSFGALAGELESIFDEGIEARMSEDAFSSMALRIFAHQFEACAVYRSFCKSRGAVPGSVEGWEDVPAVPTRGFKHVELLSGPGPEAVFHTSGTTGGAEATGLHYVPLLSLYRASLLPNFEAHLLPEGDRMPMLSLVPSPRVAPESSLSAMIGVVAEELVTEVHWLAEDQRGVDVRGFEEVAAELTGRNSPALLVGTAFGFVHLLDELARTGRCADLPDGTRIMETGGFKGRSRQVSREELYTALDLRLGVPAHRVVNEYGMTELLSQLYEPVLAEGETVRGRHVLPPWLRARALDPASLVPMPPGETGILAFFDLANAGSVSHVLTEDLGSVDADGVRLQGRAPGSEPRGCSLAVEDLLRAPSRAR